MADRKRKQKPQKPRGFRPKPYNPYPEMSLSEALIRLELEARQLPFSWRFFDGVSPNTTVIVPDFAPEFTLREYKTVILISTMFFGTLPGILEKAGLEQAALEYDGWKVVHLWDTEILVHGAAQMLNEKAPWLLNGAIHGPARPNPYQPNLMAKFREKLLQINFARTRPKAGRGGIYDRRQQRRAIRIDSRRRIRGGIKTPKEEFGTQRDRTL